MGDTRDRQLQAEGIRTASPDGLVTGPHHNAINNNNLTKHHPYSYEDIIVGDSHCVNQEADTVLLLTGNAKEHHHAFIQPGSSNLILDLSAAIAAGKQASSMFMPTDGLQDLSAHDHQREERNSDDEEEIVEISGSFEVGKIPNLPSFSTQSSLLWAGQNCNWPRQDTSNPQQPRLSPSQQQSHFPSNSYTPYLFPEARDTVLHWNPTSGYSNPRSALQQKLTKSPSSSNQNPTITEKPIPATPVSFPPSVNPPVQSQPGKVIDRAVPVPRRKSVESLKPNVTPVITAAATQSINYAHAAQIISPELSLEYLGLYSQHHTVDDITKTGMSRDHADFIRMWRDVKTMQHYYDCACGRRKPLRSVKAILQHTMKHMETAKKTYKCPKCDRVFAHYLGLNSHQRTHKDGNDDLASPPSVQGYM